MSRHTTEIGTFYEGVLRPPITRKIATGSYGLRDVRIAKAVIDGSKGGAEREYYYIVSNPKYQTGNDEPSDEEIVKAISDIYSAEVFISADREGEFKRQREIVRRFLREEGRVPEARELNITDNMSQHSFGRATQDVLRETYKRTSHVPPDSGLTGGIEPRELFVTQENSIGIKFKK